MNGKTRSHRPHPWQRPLDLRPSDRVIYAGYLLSLVALVFLAGAAASRRAQTTAESGGPITQAVAPIAASSIKSQRYMSVLGEVRQASMVSTNDEWAAQLRDPAYWAARRGEKTPASERAQRSGLTRAEPAPGFFGFFAQPTSRSKAKANTDETYDGTSRSGSRDKTFRTVCVRLCDGFYWPISFATTEENFDRDQASCERSCDGPVKLYTYRNPGSDIEDMEDVKGQSYKRLPTAFQFRTKFEPACKCKPHPWEVEAQDRHKLYALETQRAKLGKQAALELVPAIKELKTKVTDATLASRAAAKAAKTEADAEAANKQRANRKAASKTGPDRSGLDMASAESPKPSLPASDGVVIMRLGSRPPVTVKVESSLRKRAGKEQAAAD